MLRCILISAAIFLCHAILCQNICESPPQSKIENLDENANLRSKQVIIPLVVHIVYKEPKHNISKGQIHQLVGLLNQVSNEPFTLLDSNSHSAQSRVGTLGFKFELADTDPNGDNTDGIIRTLTTINNIGDILNQNDQSIIKTTEDGGSSPWDPNQYINIWIGERTISLGSTVTFNSESEDTKGIILDVSSLESNPKTLVHEMGHYLGLLHPWGNETGCDNEDDGIADTPFQSAPRFECSPVTDCGSHSNAGNIMDFSPDSCLNYFTRLQVERMHKFVMTFMSNFLQNDDCFTKNLPETYFVQSSYANIDIYTDGAINQFSVGLYSISGQHLYTGKSNGESYLKIHTAGIPTGIYLLFIHSEELMISQKVVIL
ncbi:zinc-dependent metalloprotease [Portibacter marinus]|uniref:zinc-dependent metalloprotease n=1 Tax=Portibacter marinus TaxID=2898660 RepID=UPI001F385A6F|nr:zinc-dependent metalloprotease [Portibacter marinus]